MNKYILTASIIWCHISAMRDALSFNLKIKRQIDRLFIGIRLLGTNVLYIDSHYLMKIKVRTK